VTIILLGFVVLLTGSTSLVANKVDFTIWLLDFTDFIDFG